MDDEARSIHSAAFWVEPEQSNFWWKIPGCRDRGDGANVAFVDGHVFHKRWRYLSRTRTAVDTLVKNSNDRADLAWVIRAVPSLKQP